MSKLSRNLTTRLSSTQNMSLVRLLLIVFLHLMWPSLNASESGTSRDPLRYPSRAYSNLQRLYRASDLQNIAFTYSGFLKSVFITLEQFEHPKLSTTLPELPPHHGEPPSIVRASDDIYFVCTKPLQQVMLISMNDRMSGCLVHIFCEKYI